MVRLAAAAVAEKRAGLPVRDVHRAAAAKIASYRKSRKRSAPAGGRSTQARTAALAPRIGRY